MIFRMQCSTARIQTKIVNLKFFVRVCTDQAVPVYRVRKVRNSDMNTAERHHGDRENGGAAIDKT